MVNQQLLDYIKQQLDRNISKEQIKGSLLGNGWLASDVEEAFNVITPQPPVIPPVAPAPFVAPSPVIIPDIQPISYLTNQEKPKHWKKFVLILVLIIILAGAGWYAFKYFSNAKTNNAVVAPVVNQEVAQTPPLPAENPDITRVKAILEDIRQGYLTGNEALIAQHASVETAKFFTSATAKPTLVNTFTIINVSQSGTNIVANIASSEKTLNGPMVFIKEGGDWKFDLNATMQFIIDQNNAKKGTGDPNGLPDLVVTGITISPNRPVVNNKDIQISISVKNIGTKTADEVSLEIKMLEFVGEKFPRQVEDMIPLTPGETVVETYNPYKSNDFFKISDTAGQKTIQVVLNKDRKIVESNYSNNVFTQVVQMYSN